MILSFLGDKAPFELQYRRLLVHRLTFLSLTPSQLKDEVVIHQFIIARLSQMCGLIFVSKLQQLLVDFSKSNSRPAGDLRVLTPSILCWPHRVDFSKSCLKLPREMEFALAGHSIGWMSNKRNTGKRLHLAEEHSVGEMELSVGERDYTITVSEGLGLGLGLGSG